MSGNKNLSIYLLSDTFHEGVVNLPQIKVTCKDIELDLTPYDALIFSSKNGVNAIENINKKWRKIPAYAIGNPTAKTVTKLDGNLVYAAKSSYGDDFAKEIYPKLKGKKVLFLRAKKVLSNLENILKDSGVDLKSEVVYETTCTDKKSLHVEDKNSVFIFSSPSTVECFFSQYKWKEDYIAVCIGNVTARAFPYTISLHMSKIQTIPACIKLAKTLIKQN